jgi:hypothetical protein
MSGVVDEEFLVAEGSLHDLRNLSQLLPYGLVPFLAGLSFPSLLHSQPQDLVGRVAGAPPILPTDVL